ncbi:MAG TPA: hypothetical protein VMH86_08550 [Rhizomicrobium sp.]|nr:hypothetical protein [Rhizomicrobium sp.]
MENTSDGRVERIARVAQALEGVFDECTGLLRDWMADAFKDRTLLRPMTDLMRTSSQLAGMINRFEASPPRANRGSIPQ